MSATGRGAIRVENDFYATPKWCTEAIFKHVDWDKVRSTMEPCRGDGAIYDLIPNTVLKLWSEIREGFDYLFGNGPMVDFSPSNPPYNLATEFIQKALTHCKCVAYLLRINYLGSAGRKEFLSQNRPSHLYVLSERPSFVDVCGGFPKQKIKGCGNSFPKKDHILKCPSCGARVKAGTDATEYAWICWDRGGIMKDDPGIYFL